MTYYITTYDRPFSNTWKESNELTFNTEMEARSTFNKFVTASLCSAEAIKITLRRGKMKLAEFSMSYPY